VESQSIATVEYEVKLGTAYMVDNETVVGAAYENFNIYPREFSNTYVVVRSLLPANET
jgi:hypothetical protein